MKEAGAMIKTGLLTILHKAKIARRCLQPQTLKVRFDVNQAEAYRLGFECSKPTVTLTVSVLLLSAIHRAFLADRLVGVDVCEAILRGDGSRAPAVVWQAKMFGNSKVKPWPCRLVASLPTLNALLQALEDDESRVAEQHRLRLQSRSTPRGFSHYAEALSEARAMAVSCQDAPFVVL